MNRQNSSKLRNASVRWMRPIAALVIFLIAFRVAPENTDAGEDVSSENEESFNS